MGRGMNIRSPEPRSLRIPPGRAAWLMLGIALLAGCPAGRVSAGELERMQSDPDWRRRDAMLSIVVVVLVTIVMFYFSGLFFN